MSERSYQRQANQIRPVQIIRDYTKYAPGSVLMMAGETKVLVTATIEERVPRHIYTGKDDTHGWLTAEYAMLPGATQTRNNRERNKVSGRTNEIQRLIGRCLRASVDLSQIGQRTITIDADVIQADGGTRVASITAGYVAMVDALRHLEKEGMLPGAFPKLNPVAAISVGVLGDEVIMDLDYSEDSSAEVDANVVMTADGNFIEVQATSERAPLSRQKLDSMLDMAESGIRELLKLQETAFESVGAVL